MVESIIPKDVWKEHFMDILEEKTAFCTLPFKISGHDQTWYNPKTLSELMVTMLIWIDVTGNHCRLPSTCSIWLSGANVCFAYHLTLPEAQRTQGIESVTWIRFLTELNLKTLFMSRTQYPGSVVPLAMFFFSRGGGLNFFSTFFNFWFWNLVEILKFGRHFEIWPRLWNLV